MSLRAIRAAGLKGDHFQTKSPTSASAPLHLPACAFQCSGRRTSRSTERKSKKHSTAWLGAVQSSWPRTSPGFGWLQPTRNGWDTVPGAWDKAGSRHRLFTPAICLSQGKPVLLPPRSCPGSWNLFQFHPSAATSDFDSNPPHLGRKRLQSFPAFLQQSLFQRQESTSGNP